MLAFAPFVCLKRVAIAASLSAAFAAALAAGFTVNVQAQEPGSAQDSDPEHFHGLLEGLGYFSPKHLARPIRSPSRGL